MKPIVQISLDLTIIDEALGPCAKTCCAGCPHSHTVGANDGTSASAQFALAAC